MTIEALSQHPGETVIVDFSADWCPPCKMLARILPQMAEARGLRLLVVDVGQDPAAAAKHTIRSMPTLVAFRDGVEIGREVGFRGRGGLAAFLDAQTNSVSMSCAF